MSSASKELFSRVKSYADLLAPSGFESPIRSRLLADWADLETEVQPIGNVIGHIGGSGPKLLIESHMDEIGLLVKSITSQGFLCVTQGAFGSEQSSPPDSWLRMQKVKVKGKQDWHDGVIGLATAHVLTPEQLQKHNLTWGDIFVDLGLRNDTEVSQLGVRVGSPIVFSSELSRLGSHICGKALDARACLAIMTELIPRLKGKKLHYEVFLGATVQEETSLVGAGSLAQHSNWDYIIGLEVGLAGDVPSVQTSQMPTTLGAGPVVVIKDRFVVYDQDMLDRLMSVGHQAGIPIQLAIFHGFSSDLKAFMDRGIPSSLITFPTRYTHTPYEVASLTDLTGIVDLLVAFLCSKP